MSQHPRYTRTLPNTGRGLNADLWINLLERYVSNDPAFGVRWKSDFVDGLVALTGTTSATTDADWTVQDAATAGGTYSFAKVAGPDGYGRLNSTGTTNHQGVEAIGTAWVTLPTTHSVEADRRGDVVLQCRFDQSDADTIFIGLGESLSFLSASSALPTGQDYIGFYTVDNGATWDFVCANDNAGGTAVTCVYDINTAFTEDAGSNVQNFGLRVFRDGHVELSINGYRVTDKQINENATISSGTLDDALPIEDLALVLAATAGGGTTAPTVDIDTLDCYVDSGSSV